MSDADFQLQALRDPRLAVHAISGTPVWLWSADGARILWSNPNAARAFGAANSFVLANKAVGPADPHRRQVTQLAARLPSDGAVRLERLRGFGASLGRLMTCACSRLTLSDGTPAVLVAAAESAGRTLGLNDRLSSVLDSIAKPALAFTADGAFAGANEAAKMFASHLSDLASPTADAARKVALQDGSATFALNFGETSLHRIGSGSDIYLVATTDTAIPEPVVAPVAHIVEPTIVDPAGKEAVIADAVSSQAEKTIVQLEGTIAPLTETTNAEATTLHWSDAAVATVLSDTSPADPVVLQTTETMPADVFESAFDDVELRKEEDVAPDAGIASPLLTPEPVAIHADAPSQETIQNTHEPPSLAPPPIATSHVAAGNISATLAQMDGPPLSARRHPLRFMWQMDQDSRFSLGSDEFSRLIGMRTASAFGRLWGEIADVLGLDPEGKVAAAIASRDTWSGIVVTWPADDSGTRLPVELSGLPIYDRGRNFIGYRGFGVCRDLEGLARLAAQRRDEGSVFIGCARDEIRNGVRYQ